MWGWVWVLGWGYGVEVVVRMNQTTPPRPLHQGPMQSVSVQTDAVVHPLNTDVVAELLGAPWCADLHVNDEEALLWAADNGHEVRSQTVVSCLMQLLP